MQFSRCVCVWGIAVLALGGACTDPPDDPVPPPVSPAPPPAVGGALPTVPRTPRRLRRLNNFEMENVLADVLGARLELTRGFLADPRDEGYDNDAATLTVSVSKVDEVATAAERAAALITADGNLSRFAPCPALDQAATCARDFAARLTRAAWGRPATETELGRLGGVFQVGMSDEGYAAGIGLVTQTVLQSPHFVYVSELGGEPADGQVRLTGFEIASQLSFLLRGARPDPALFEAAAAGALETEAGRERQARRLLLAPESRRHLLRFFRSWLGLTRPINKDLAVVPIFVPEMRVAVERELDTFVDHVLGTSTRLDDFMLADYSFPGKLMTAIYGEDLLEPAGDFTRAQLAPRRRGLLSMPAFLAGHSLISQTSPVERGLIVRSRLLCQDVAPPPPDVSTVPPGGPAGQTTRDRYAAHSSQPRCRACHQLMDPLGFGLEAFDLLGRYRTKEGDAPIDASGEIVGTDVDGPFTGPAELAGRLMTSAHFRRCFVQQVWRFSESRPATLADEPELAALAGKFEEGQHRLDELLVAYVRKPTFILRKVVP